MDRPWKVISAFVGVFIAGAVFGGFFTLRSVDRVVDAARGKGTTAKAPATKPAPAAPAAPAPAKGIAPQVMRQLTQRLSPTPEQQKAIRPIVSRAAEDLQRMQREHLADTTRTTERMYADVSALLTPAQRTQLEQMRQEMLERVRKVREKRDETPAEGTAKSTPAGTPPAAR